MRRAIVIFVVLLASQASAQPANDHMHLGHTAAMSATATASAIPTQPGQAAFAAIQEIVEILESDPSTDWSKVDIEGLRQHLIDMDNVTLRADVKTERSDGSIRFVVSGSGSVIDSIQRRSRPMP